MDNDFKKALTGIAICCTIAYGAHVLNKHKDYLFRNDSSKSADTVSVDSLSSKPRIYTHKDSTITNNSIINYDAYERLIMTIPEDSDDSDNLIKKIDIYRGNKLLITNYGDSAVIKYDDLSPKDSIDDKLKN